MYQWNICLTDICFFFVEKGQNRLPWKPWLSWFLLKIMFINGSRCYLCTLYNREQPLIATRLRITQNERLPMLRGTFKTLSMMLASEMSTTVEAKMHQAGSVSVTAFRFQLELDLIECFSCEIKTKTVIWIILAPRYQWNICLPNMFFFRNQSKLVAMETMISMFLLKIKIPMVSNNVTTQYGTKSGL